MAPSYAARPIVFYVEHRDTTLVLFPVSEESVLGDEFGPPGRLVKLVKALADEGSPQGPVRAARRELTGGDRGTPGRAAHQPLASHPDPAQRGLVRATKGTGNQSTYALQEEVLPQVSELLEQFLAGEPAARLAKPLRRR